MVSPTGKSLKGYRIHESVGKGGFGAVYRAVRSIGTVEQDVAIKVILPEYANQPEFIRGFEAEAQIVARLEHPYIAPLIDFWREPDGAYLVIRYLRGGSLSARLRQGALPLDIVVHTLDHITEALAFAHRHDVVHRDLKPDNILFDTDDNAYLTDFGIAVAIGRGATDDTITGSIAYMAPEQLNNQPASPAVDIYSLGIVLYEMLTGKHPFGESASVAELIHKHLNEPLPPLPDSFPGAINVILQKATAKTTNHRFDDARQIAALFRRAVAGEGVVPAETLILEDVKVSNPYKGLRAFQQADAPQFFGREILTKRLLGRLGETGEAARFLAVVGPSGSGKSSVARAGMIPALQQGGLEGSEKWFIADMIPGPYPLDELEVALTRVAASPGVDIMAQLQRDAQGLHRVTGMLLPEDGELLLVIDQFEEVFTVVAEEAQRRHFLALLGEAVSHPRSRVRVVITLRADFYDRPLMSPVLSELVRQRTEVVVPLTPGELEQAICRPAAQAGVTVEPGLVAAMVAEVTEQPGSLPLLQFSLTELYDRRGDHTLTLSTYNQIGGVLGALTRRADEIYASLNTTAQGVLRQLFLRLVTLGEGTGDLRRRVRVSELSALGVDRQVLDELIAGFANYRLLTMDHDPTTREAMVEVAHEALIREWRQLREWLDESRDDIRLQRMLAAAAKDWRDANKEASYLLAGARLTQFEAWAQTTDVALTQDEREFLEISITEEKRRQARRRLIRNAVLAIMAIVIVVVSGLALFAFDRERQAESALKIAEREAEVNHSLVLANTAQDEFERGLSERALALALEAAKIPDPPQSSIAALTQIAYGPGIHAYLQGHTHPVYAVAFSPDQTIGLSGSCASLDETGDCSAGEIIVWNLATRRELVRLGEHTDWINALAFQPGVSSQIALSASEDGNILLWDIANQEVLRRFTGHDGGVNAVAFSPDGQTFLSGGDDGVILLWNVNSGDILKRFTGHDGSVNTIAFSPDGQTFLSGGNDGVVLLWNVDSGDIIQRFIGHTSSVTAVAIWPGAQEILSVSADFTLRSWELETGNERYQFNYAVHIFCLGVTPDGRTAAVCLDFGIGLWDIAEQIKREKLHPSSENIESHLSMVVSPDGQQVMVGLRNGLVVVWILGVQPEISRIELPDTLFTTVDVRQDERYLLLGTAAGSTILWDVERGREIRRFEGQAGVMAFSEFTPDGQKALIGSSDWFSGSGETDLILWDIETGEIIHKLVGHRWYVRAMAFSPDGRLALTGSQPYPNNPSGMPNGDLILWNLETGELIWRVERSGSVTGIVFSADSRQALTASDTLGEPVLTLWDIATAQPMREFQSIGGLGVYAVAYSPDERAALTADGNGMILLRDLATGEVIRTLIGHEDWILSMTVSPDRQYILSGDDTGLIILWDYATGHELRRIQAHQSAVYWIAFTSDSQSAFTSALGGPSVVQWRVGEQSLDELRAWIAENRYVAEFTCQERELYRIEPYCEDGE